MTTHPIDTYRRVLGRDLQAGNATEPTHFPTLKALIQSLASGVTARVWWPLSGKELRFRMREELRSYSETVRML